MTTDYLALIASANSKTAATDKLSVKFDFNSSSQDTGMFDSLLSNASKSYADTSYAESSYFNNGDYAHKTKDIQSAKTNKTDYSSNSKTDDYSQNNINDKTTRDTKFEAKDKTSVENSADNEYKNDVENSSEKNDVQDTDKSDIKNDKTENLNKNEETNQSEEQQTQDKDNNSSNEKDNPQDKTDDSQDLQTKQEETLKQQELAAKNIIATEQIAANVEGMTEIPRQIQETQIIDNTLDSANETTDAAVQKTTAKTVEQAAVSEIKQSDLKQQTVDQEILDKAIQNAANQKDVSTLNIQQAPVQETQQNKPAQQTQQTPVQNNPKQDVSVEIQSNTDIDVDVKVDAQTVESQKLNTETTANTVKTAKENLASDNTRYTVNIENAVKNQADDTAAVITPTTKPEITTEQSQIPVVKVTDEVAAQANTTETLPLNKDFSASAKDKAAAQMTQLQDTDTVVTEVKNTTNNQAQANAGQSNNSMAQGNASEQIIKFSVDDTSTTNISTNPAESFISKLDAKLGSLSKAASQGSLLNKSDIMTQLNAKFNDMFQAGQNKVSMILQPENLGRVSVEIVNSKDGIVAKMTTENQQVKELLDKNMDALRSNLSSQGVNVNNIKVECTNETSQNAMNFEREQFNQSSFSNHSGQNHQTHNSEQNSNSVYSNDFTTNEETAEDAAAAAQEPETVSVAQHNGKVDYKV